MPATDEAVALAIVAADAADDVKATDLAVLDVADLLAIVDVFLLASAGSDRQLRAAADRIEERLRAHDRRVIRREGSAESGWLLLDYGDLVCHLFAVEQREFYALDRLWADVPRRVPRTGEPLAPAMSAAARPAADLDLEIGPGAGSVDPTA